MQGKYPMKADRALWDTNCLRETMWSPNPYVRIVWLCPRSFCVLWCPSAFACMWECVTLAPTWLAATVTVVPTNVMFRGRWRNYAKMKAQSTWVLEPRKGWWKQAGFILKTTWCFDTLVFWSLAMFRMSLSLHFAFCNLFFFFMLCLKYPM